MRGACAGAGARINTANEANAISPTDRARRLTPVVRIARLRAFLLGDDVFEAQLPELEGDGLATPDRTALVAVERRVVLREVRLHQVEPAISVVIANVHTHACLLATVGERLAADGLVPRRVDITIVGSRPRLGAHLDEMRTAIAGIVGLDPASVSVKASTGNLGGDEGAGRSMSAQAVAIVGPAR